MLYRGELEGLDHEFKEFLTRRLDIASYVSTLRILDYLQYTNPPYVQRKMAVDLSEPQSRISQLVDSLEERGVRVRLDFSHVPLGLKLLIVIVEGARALTNRLPLVDWVSVAYRISRGVLAVYRAPADKASEIIDILRTRTTLIAMSKSSVKAEFFEVEDGLLARPSLEYWLYRVFDEYPGLEKVNPINAFDLLERHPRRIDTSNSLDLEEDIAFYPGEPYIGFRDIYDLVLLSHMERSIFHIKSHNIDEMLLRTFGKPKLQTLAHEKHVASLSRGSRVVTHGTDPQRGVMNLVCIAEGSERAVRELARDLKKHPYAYSLAKLKNVGLFFTMSMPVAYVNRLALEVEDRYGVDVTHIYQVSIEDVLLRQTIPFRNYDQANRRWSFDNTVGTVLLNYLRGFVSTKEKIERDVREYIEMAKSSYGEDRVLDAVRELGFDSINDLIDEVERAKRKRREMKTQR